MVQRQGALGLRARPLGDFHLVFDMDFGEKEHFVVTLLDVPFHFGFQRAVVGGDMARVQRTGKSAGHSRADGGDDVVDGGRQFFLDRCLVPGFDAAVHAGADGLRVDDV